ncbi:hypothetical protein XA68_14802 [Ophiocordyceps unilateralis]|uniref:Uncharacterized protein n=1 Tax=Ophiocordyceps unilateralis TaxID=268505 RepID=A0A2A9P7U7_OPHUN|nr:hypothetical protein XA68_14802 [Ophiocordyceps unilateralis]
MASTSSPNDAETKSAVATLRDWGSSSLPPCLLATLALRRAARAFQPPGLACTRFWPCAVASPFARN